MGLPLTAGGDCSVSPALPVRAISLLETRHADAALAPQACGLLAAAAASGCGASPLLRSLVLDALPLPHPNKMANPHHEVAALQAASLALRQAVSNRGAATRGLNRHHPGLPVRRRHCFGSLAAPLLPAFSEKSCSTEKSSRTLTLGALQAPQAEAGAEGGAGEIAGSVVGAGEAPVARAGIAGGGGGGGAAGGLSTVAMGMPMSRATGACLAQAPPAGGRSGANEAAVRASLANADTTMMSEEEIRAVGAKKHPPGEHPGAPLHQQGELRAPQWAT